MTITTLYSPVKLGRYQLEHRVVMAPTGRFRCTLEGVPTELVAEYYGQRASPGGLLITEATAIHKSAGPYPHVAGIFTKEQIEGYKLATEAVHKKGGLFFVQLWHGGRVTASAFMPNGEQIVSASDIPVAGKNRFLEDADYEVPRPLTRSEIKDVIQLYKQAALNAIEAGFDGVELHGANGYLIDQFINSNSNNRTDEYGGSVENRARFAIEVVDAVAEAIGEDRTAIRFSPGGSFNGVRDDTVVETWSYLTSQLQKNHPNLAYIHFIERRYDIDTEVDSISDDSLEPFRKIWKGTFIASGGFSTAREKAFEYAQQHDVLISFGRAFIANPDLPERLRNNWPLNPYHRPTFYTHDAVGYTDYPFYNSKVQA